MEVYPWNVVLLALPPPDPALSALSAAKRSREEEDELPFEPKKKRPRNGMLEGCRSVESFEHLNKIDEGAYGVVYRARDRETREIVAIKKVKLEKEKEGFPITSIREINTLLSLKHPNIVCVNEVVYGSSLDKIYMVLEYMDHELKSILEDKRCSFTHAHIKNLMYQLLQAVAYMHERWVFHRDLKTSNLLLNNEGMLKVCDFGLARKYCSPIRPYTHMVVTLWYRAPELLLGTRVYTPAIDMWSVGCIFAELLLKEPLLMGKGELDQLERMFRLLGNPTEERWPGWRELKHAQHIKLPKKSTQCKLREKFPRIAFGNDMFLSDKGVDLMTRMLTYDPSKRITAEEALLHEWFSEDPLPAERLEMPKFASQNEMSRELLRKKRKKSLDEEQIRQREEMYENEDRFELIKNKDYFIKK